jgi:hypothetical protein
MFSKNLFILLPPPLSDLIYCTELAVVETLAALDALILIDDVLLLNASGNSSNRAVPSAKSTSLTLVIDAELDESLAGMSCALVFVDVVFVLVSEVANR